MHCHGTRLYDDIPVPARDAGGTLDDRIVLWKQPGVTLVFDVVRHAIPDVVDGRHEVFAGDLEVWEVVYVEDGLRFGDVVGKGGVCGGEGAVVGEGEEVRCGQVVRHRLEGKDKRFDAEDHG